MLNRPLMLIRPDATPEVADLGGLRGIGILHVEELVQAREYVRFQPNRLSETHWPCAIDELAGDAILLVRETSGRSNRSR